MENKSNQIVDLQKALHFFLKMLVCSTAGHDMFLQFFFYDCQEKQFFHKARFALSSINMSLFDEASGGKFK